MNLTVINLDQETTALQKIKEELLSSVDKWRYVETLASKAETQYEMAVQLLYQDSGIMFSVNKESQKLLVKLTTPDFSPVLSGIGFDRKVISIGDARIPYLVHKPLDYLNKKHPVILFLHGSGERGDNGVSQMREGLGPTLRRRPDLYPAVVVMPQLPRGLRWEHRLNEVSVADLVLKSLSSTLVEYNGDPDCQYLTGISMGGFGCWDIAARHPDLFAAVVPICGGGNPGTVTQQLAELPLWVFHGQFDIQVPVWRATEMIDAVKRAGGMNIKGKIIGDREVSAKEFTRADHFIWDEVYGYGPMIDWLFTQKRGSGT